jgi:uncharacterized lipoprotein YajG
MKKLLVLLIIISLSACTKSQQTDTLSKVTFQVSYNGTPAVHALMFVIADTANWCKKGICVTNASTYDDGNTRVAQLVPKRDFIVKLFFDIDQKHFFYKTFNISPRKDIEVFNVSISDADTSPGGCR